MPVPVRPDLSEENLRLLLAEGHESETLDYKSFCDLSSTDDLLEITKDIGAMQIRGGYIVIGADDYGEPTNQVTTAHVRLFEQATMRAKVGKYLPEPLDLRARHHCIDGHDYILVYIAENDDGFAIFKSTGNNSKNSSVFRKGEVFSRHGTASEPWSQHDITTILSKLVSREKESWRKEATETFATRLPSSAGSSIASGPASALTWQLDEDTFMEVVIEQIRKDDLVPLKLLLTNVRSEMGTMLTEVDGKECVEVVLNRLTCLAAFLLRLDQEDPFRSVIEAFVAIYNLPIDNQGVYRKNQPISANLLWFMVVQRIAGIGAYAERLQKWEAVRLLVLQRGRGYEFEHNRNWYRHALTMAARADLLYIKQGESRITSSLLSFVQVQVERLACLRPDLYADDEELLDSICRFDVLACIVGIDDAGAPDSSAYYPSFAKYYQHRYSHSVVALLENRKMRDTLFHGSDVKLAEALSAINVTAEREGFASWGGFGDQKVQEFLKRFRTPVQQQ